MKLFYIGSGPISNFHIPALKSVGFNITGIATRLNSKRCEEFSLKHGLGDVYEKGGWEKGLQNNNFDCIVLAVDTKYTPDILNKIMHYEIPILVEKPVGWHPIQLEKLIESNPSGTQKVMVAYNRRYYKIVDLLKDYIDNNDQGLITISIPDSISSIRQFLVNGCHMVDLLCYLMPELTLNYCKCNLKSDGNISSIVGLGEYKSNWQILINSVPEAPDNFEIKVSSGPNVYRLRPIEVLEIFEGMEIVQPSEEMPLRRYLPKLSERIIEDTTFKPGFYSQANDFYNFCKYDKKSKSFCSLEDAYKTLQICYQLLSSNKLNYEDSIKL